MKKIHGLLLSIKINQCRCKRRPYRPRIPRILGSGILGLCLFFYSCSSVAEEAYPSAGNHPVNSVHSAGDIRKGALRKIVFALVSSAENSSIDYNQQYSYIEDIEDGRGYTAGIIGFTSGTGDLLEVVRTYGELKPESNLLIRYLPALEKVDGSDSHEGLGDDFIRDWKKAAGDSEMISAQNQIVESMYLSPAVDYADTDGLSVLGQYIYYDALVVHGPGDDKDSFNGIRMAAIKKELPPSQGGREEDYLYAFLKARGRIMKKEEAHEDLSRLETQESFMEGGNSNLELPLEWVMYGDDFILTEALLNSLE